MDTRLDLLLFLVPVLGERILHHILCIDISVEGLSLSTSFTVIPRVSRIKWVVEILKGFSLSALMTHRYNLLLRGKLGYCPIK